LTGTLAISALSLPLACGGSPMAATDPTTATIESVVTTFRGALVESAPITIPSPEALDVETRFTLNAPPESRVTLYLCVLESPSSIGVGACVSVSSTAREVQQRAASTRMGISPFKTDGVSRTTNYVYVALTEGSSPWVPAGGPPRVGDTFAGNRVLVTGLVPRTVTFR